MADHEVYRLPDVYGPGEAAELLGVSATRLKILVKTDDLMPPHRLLGNRVKVWDGPSLRAYKHTRRFSGRGELRRRLLLSYRNTGNLAASCHRLDVPVSTGQRWLKQAGVDTSRSTKGPA